MLRSTYEGQIIGQVEKMNDVVKLFNTKSELPVTNSDAHRLLKYARKVMTHLTEWSMKGCFYVIGSHQKQLRTLIRNPIDCSRKCQELPAAHDFKENLNLKSLKSWRASETITVTPSERRKSGKANRRTLLRRRCS